MTGKITLKEVDFLWKSIVHLGAGIYLIGLTLWFGLATLNGSVTYTRDFGTPIDLAIVGFSAIFCFVIFYLDYKEITKK